MRPITNPITRARYEASVRHHIKMAALWSSYVEARDKAFDELGWGDKYAARCTELQAELEARESEANSEFERERALIGHA
jgi:hypothetical protein